MTEVAAGHFEHCKMDVVGAVRVQDRNSEMQSFVGNLEVQVQQLAVVVVGIRSLLLDVDYKLELVCLFEIAVVVVVVDDELQTDCDTTVDDQIVVDCCCCTEDQYFVAELFHSN